MTPLAQTKESLGLFVVGECGIDDFLLAEGFGALLLDLGVEGIAVTDSRDVVSFTKC